MPAAKKALLLPGRDQQAGGRGGLIPSIEQSYCRRGPAWGQPLYCRWSCFLIQVSQYLPDHRRVFNTGDYPDLAAAFTAGFDVDIEHAFQTLCPLVRMSRCRVAHGCAGAASLLMPGARPGFDRVSLVVF